MHQGDGCIHRRATTEMLFIPQRPYMVLGSLRKQILYPQKQREFLVLEILGEGTWRLFPADTADYSMSG